MDAHAIIADEIAKTRKAHGGAATDYPRWLALGHEVAALERLRLRLATPAMDEVEELVELWKGETYLDICEERNPVADEFGSGFNQGLTKARDMIYARLPPLLTKALTVSPKKLEAAAKAILFGTRQKRGRGHFYISVDDASKVARAAAIALGLRVEEETASDRLVSHLSDGGR